MSLLARGITALESVAWAQKEQARHQERYNVLYADMVRHTRDLGEATQALTQELLTQLETKDEDLDSHPSGCLCDAHTDGMTGKSLKA